MVPWDASLHSSPGQTELLASVLYQDGEAGEDKNWEYHVTQHKTETEIWQKK